MARIAAIEEPCTPRTADPTIAEGLSHIDPPDQVYVRAETLDAIFGTGCVEQLVAAQKTDPIYAPLHVTPSHYRNFRAARGTDDLLRLDGRICIPIAFRWHD